VLKEGPAEDYANREAIAKLLRFSSTRSDSEEPTVSLADYVGRMGEGQEKIYYLSAESFAAARHSPHLEIFRKKGIEVLLLHERVDEWLMAHLDEFEGKRLQSVAKGDLDLDAAASDEEKAAREEARERLGGLVERVKVALAERVKEVRLSHRLTESPACVVADEQGMSQHLERLLRQAGQAVPASLPVLELNPEHELVKRLEGEQQQDRFRDLALVLLEQSVLAEGGQLDDPAAFVHRLNGLLLERIG
jgi:molecular chaperone HtpG